MPAVEKESLDKTGCAATSSRSTRAGHVPPLPVQEVHRRPPGVRPGARHRLVRRRHRQLRVSAHSASTSAFSASTRTAKPASTQALLSLEQHRGQEGDLVFVSGHPGTTNGWKLSARLEHRRDHDAAVHPEPAAPARGDAAADGRASGRKLPGCPPATCTGSPTPARPATGSTRACSIPDASLIRNRKQALRQRSGRRS